MNGLALQSQLATDHRQVPIIFLSGNSEPGTRLQALQAGAVAFLGKPCNEEALMRAVQSAMAK
jgi:FixJ family two-component response regulator